MLFASSYFINKFSRSSQRFVIFGVSALLSATITSDQSLAGGDLKNEPMEIVQIQRSKKRKGLEHKISTETTKRPKVNFVRTPLKDLNAYQSQAENRHLNNLKAAILGGLQTSENKLAMNALKAPHREKLLSRIRYFSSDIKDLFLSLSLPHECIDRRHRRMVVKDQRVLKISAGPIIQTLLKTYLQINGKGLIENIDLSNSQITDDDLTWVTLHFPNLTSLSLWNTQITDAGLAHIAKLNNLTSLHLGGTQVTDAGLAYISGLNSLTSLHLGGTQITGVGLAHVARLNSLTSLDLGGTEITDAGLAHVARLNSLTSLDLGGTQITDAGLAHVARLNSLTSLNLGGTQITDAGLQQLPLRLRYF